MIHVIIKSSFISPIPNIVKHHKTITTMFEIRKEIVNSIGNVQRSEQIGFVNCTKDELISSIANNYYNLARADTLYYKLRGQSYTVRYVFIYKSLATIADAVKHAKANIKARVDEANEYITAANAAYKESNKREVLKINLWY